jgi:hypothetical protein
MSKDARNASGAAPPLQSPRRRATPPDRTDTSDDPSRALPNSLHRAVPAVINAEPPN